MQKPCLYSTAVCTDYIEKWPYSFFYKSYTFLPIYSCYLNKNDWNIYEWQKCIDFIEKWPSMVIFLYNLYIFLPFYSVASQWWCIDYNKKIPFYSAVSQQPCIDYIEKMTTNGNFYIQSVHFHLTPAFLWSIFKDVISKTVVFWTMLWWCCCCCYQ